LEPAGSSQNAVTMRTELLRFNGAVERDPAIGAWMKEHAGGLEAIAHQSCPDTPRSGRRRDTEPSPPARFAAKPFMHQHLKEVWYPMPFRVASSRALATSVRAGA